MADPAYSDKGCTGSTPLVVGTALGRRTFFLDEHGVLRGVTYRAPWRDGENVAECFVTKRVAPTAGPTYTHATALPPYVAAGVIFPGDDIEVQPWTLAPGFKWDRCDGLAPDCGCGFYAYHSVETTYAVGGAGCKVIAIIEGYGKLILGDKGYRASKARIAAVLLPRNTSAAQRRKQVERSLTDCADALAALGDKPGYNVASVPLLITAALALATAWKASDHMAGALVVAGYVTLATVINEKQSRAAYHSLKQSLETDHKTLTETLRSMPDDYSKHIERCMERYKGARFYTDPLEMARDWPVVSLADLAREAQIEKAEGDE